VLNSISIAKNTVYNRVIIGRKTVPQNGQSSMASPHKSSLIKIKETISP